MLLILKEVEGHSVEELAEQTGMNENTIKVKLFRARQKLVKPPSDLSVLPAFRLVEIRFAEPAGASTGVRKFCLSKRS